jgi:hypothetical protein
MNAPETEHLGLARRLFRKRWFAFLWLVFMASVFIFVAWPAREIALVCWTYGADGYLHQGIRVVQEKPTTFSNGELAPLLPNLVTGFGAFFLTFGGLMGMLLLALNIYERFSQSRNN